ncbi:MAG: hypothetical protein AABW89_05045 [Nanoarchaeota archaeon]
MVSNPFKNQEPSVEKQMNERKKLMASFVNVHGSPIIVHAIHDKKVFHKVLTDGKLKLPNVHQSLRKAPYIEKLLRLDNCIYYSLGFVYFSSYYWKYNLIFDIKFLKELEYYNNSVNFQAVRNIVDYWYLKDREYLERLANTNEITRATINKYYNKDYKGEVRKFLEYWKIEKELFEFIENYSNEKVLFKIIRRVLKKHFLKYPGSEEDALGCYLQDKAPEIVGRKENDLLKNPYFLGFFISGKVEKDILSILRSNYSNKIIFDGEKVKKISDL